MGLPIIANMCRRNDYSMWKYPPPARTKTSASNDATAASRSPIRRRRSPVSSLGPSTGHTNIHYSHLAARLSRTQLVRTNVYMTTQQINDSAARFEAQRAADDSRVPQAELPLPPAPESRHFRRTTGAPARSRVRRENARPLRSAVPQTRDLTEVDRNMRSRYQPRNAASVSHNVLLPVASQGFLDPERYVALGQVQPPPRLNVPDGPVYSTALARSPSNISASSFAADGLGDRDRSVGSEGDHWETMLTTITPDAHLPTPDSSFTSAAASASFGPASNRASEQYDGARGTTSSSNSSFPSASSSTTQLTVPSSHERDHHHSMVNDPTACDSDMSGSETEAEVLHGNDGSFSRLRAESDSDRMQGPPPSLLPWFTARSDSRSNNHGSVSRYQHRSGHNRRTAPTNFSSGNDSMNRNIGPGPASESISSHQRFMGRNLSGNPVPFYRGLDVDHYASSMPEAREERTIWARSPLRNAMNQFLLEQGIAPQSTRTETPEERMTRHAHMSAFLADAAATQMMQNIRNRYDRGPGLAEANEGDEVRSTGVLGDIGRGITASREHALNNFVGTVPRLGSDSPASTALEPARHTYVENIPRSSGNAAHRVTEDAELEVYRPIEGHLARREDVPEDYWMGVGLSPAIPRPE